MAEPKKRLTQTRSGNRRSHLALKSQLLAVCSSCKENVRPHHICLVCGTYNNEKVLKIKDKNKKK